VDEVRGYTVKPVRRGNAVTLKPNPLGCASWIPWSEAPKLDCSR